MTISYQIACPFCAEAIQFKAKKCRFCGEFLESDLNREAILLEFFRQKQAFLADQSQSHGPGAKAIESVTLPSPSEESSQEDTPIVVKSESGETAVKSTSALSNLYAKIESMPDSEEKQKVLQSLQLLEEEAQKGDDADESNIENVIKNVAMVLPDVAEITINTMINPASGLTTLIQKVAQRVADSRNKKPDADKNETELDDSEPVPSEAPQPAADVEEVTEALQELQENLADSPEKEIVEQALAEMETENADSKESKSEEAEESENSLGEMVEGIAKVAEVMTDAETGEANESSAGKLLDGIVDVVKNVVEKQVAE